MVKLFCLLKFLQQLSREFIKITEKIALFLQSNIALARHTLYVNSNCHIDGAILAAQGQVENCHGDTSNHQQVRLNLKMVLRKVYN